MPELPEVESIKKVLQKKLIGKVITHTTIYKPKLVSSSSNIRVPLQYKIDEFIDKTTNSTIVNVTRIAKNIIIELSTGILIIHLKMTGQLTYGNNLPHKHTCVDFILDDGQHLLYNDIRQFGYVLYFNSYLEAMTEGHLVINGFDPYIEKLNSIVIHAKLTKVKKPIKSLLLDQKIILGLGNIYVDETLFDANILPTRLCSTLKSSEVKKLTESITRIIHDAVNKGGSSISDYILPDGSKGNYANYHRIYGRKNQDCLVCLNPLSNIKITGRTTIFCSICQK